MLQEWLRLGQEKSVNFIELRLPQSLDDADFDRLMKEALAAVTADAGGQWVLDLTALDYAGSALLGLMVNIRQKVRAEGGQLVLCGVSSRLLQILQTCSLERLFKISKSRADAIRSMS